MGRAGRSKKGMPPGLGDLEEHGVPEGWHEYWHGQQSNMSPFSPMLPQGANKSIFDDLQKPWEYRDLLRLVSSLQWSEVAEGDLLLEAVAKNQLRSFQKDQEVLPDLQPLNKKAFKITDQQGWHLWGQILQGALSWDPAEAIDLMKSDPDAFEAFARRSLLPGIVEANRSEGALLFQNKRFEPLWRGLASLWGDDPSFFAEEMSKNEGIRREDFWEEWLVAIGRREYEDDFSYVEDNPTAWAAYRSFQRMGDREMFSDRREVAQWVADKASINRDMVFDMLPHLRNLRDGQAMWADLSEGMAHPAFREGWQRVASGEFSFRYILSRLAAQRFW